ncbi:APR-like 5 [Hibiscus trionum]|uniref:APR-like 5 n=1 Tax=Hibiscus trionum TaxID=183268 RepID=A0A9W7HKQ3_HIBTR|nr:APR-like 5 [Hibiscus trionum]
MGSCSSLLLLLYITAIYSTSCVFGSPICSHESDEFIKNLTFQCSPIPPLEVDGNFLARVLTSKQRNGYVSVLFYASWCPFSRSLGPKFNVLSSMFPQLEHLAVEESSASPSIFSRYGIHSLPSILIVNQTSRIQYRGPKDLPSIVQFYEKTTGFEPVQYVAENEPVASGDNNKYMIQLWNEAFSIEIVKREPYLAFSMLFLCLRLLLSIFGETSQMFARALHMVDVRRVWTKLRLCKAGNLHQGEQSPRVWPSSLASVSSGKSSSGPVLGCWKNSSISRVFSPTRTRM